MPTEEKPLPPKEDTTIDQLLEKISSLEDKYKKLEAANAQTIALNRALLVKKEEPKQEVKSSIDDEKKALKERLDKFIHE